MAQGLGRRFLAGGLALYMPDLWLICDHFVGSVRYGSTNQANSAFHPFEDGERVVISIIILITGAETIKRHTRAAYGCSVKGQSPWART